MPHPTLIEAWWTPWPGIGPGSELLGDLAGLTVVELGCGRGDNAAAFAHHGATVTGIDRDPAKLEHARQRWDQVPRLRFEHADATSHLAALEAPVDVVCSIFGALSFNPPGPLLDQIAPQLAPGARLAIATRTRPKRPTPRRDQTWSTHTNNLPVWLHLLAERDLHPKIASVLDHPTDPNAPGCLIIVASHPTATQVAAAGAPAAESRAAGISTTGSPGDHPARDAPFQRSWHETASDCPQSPDDRLSKPSGRPPFRGPHPGDRRRGNSVL